MCEHLRPWKRPPKSSQFVSESMIRRARLTPFQVAVIEEILLEQESKRTRIEIDALGKRIAALKTPEGREEERDRLKFERDRAMQGLEDLETLDGVGRACLIYSSMMERYELQNVERDKILETLRKQRRTNQELFGGDDHA